MAVGTCRMRDRVRAQDLHSGTRITKILDSGQHTATKRRQAQSVSLRSPQGKRRGDATARQLGR